MAIDWNFNSDGLRALGDNMRRRSRASRIPQIYKGAEPKKGKRLACIDFVVRRGRSPKIAALKSSTRRIPISEGASW